MSEKEILDAGWGDAKPKPKSINISGDLVAMAINFCMVFSPIVTQKEFIWGFHSMFFMGGLESMHKCFRKIEARRQLQAAQLDESEIPNFEERLPIWHWILVINIFVSGVLLCMRNDDKMWFYLGIFAILTSIIPWNKIFKKAK